MLNESRFISEYIGELKNAMDDTAHASCKMPKPSPFDHGVQVGIYQGLHMALMRLEAKIEDAAEKERKS